MIGARRLAVAGLVVTAALLGACGGSDAASTTKTAKAPTSSKAGTSVVIDTFMFMPASLRVPAGTTVTWTNHDDILHTVTSGTREYEPGNGGAVTATHKDGMFDNQLDGKGKTASFTFSTPGTYHYFCNRHPGMEADVDVT